MTGVQTCALPISDKYFTSLPYEEGLIDLDKKYGEILIETNDKNKIEEGIFRLNRSLKSTSWYNRAPAFFSLAKGYINNGNIKLGEAMLDSMSNVISKSQQKLYIGGANEFALEHYLNTNNTNKIIKYSKEYLE